MAKKKAFVVRIDPDTLKAVEKWAADEFRSTNGQIEWMLHRSLREAGRLKDANKSSGSKDKDENA